jgi:hypothetical protein
MRGLEYLEKMDYVGTVNNDFEMWLQSRNTLFIVEYVERKEKIGEINLIRKHPANRFGLRAESAAQGSISTIHSGSTPFSSNIHESQPDKSHQLESG